MVSKMICDRCKGSIDMGAMHKIVIYVVKGKFTENHYEHVECPDRFTT